MKQDSVVYFSVVIPLYNKENEIERAVRSVLNQSCKHFELIVVDDGSTDQSAAKVRIFQDERLRFVQQKNSGVSAARNRGALEARYDYVAFLDADDEWDCDYLSVITRLISEYPAGGIYATAYRKERSNDASLCRLTGIPARPWEGVVTNYFAVALLSDPIVTASTATMNIQVFRQSGGFRHGAKRGEDLDLWARIAVNHPIVFSWDVGAIYYMNSTNRSIEVETYNVPFAETLGKLIEKDLVPVAIKSDVMDYAAKLTFDETVRGLSRNLSAKAARRILRGTRAGTKRLRRKIDLIYFMSYFPRAILRKMLTARSSWAMSFVMRAITPATRNY
jgi:glycosyltransferase involved in cell wall biosynthesis